MMVHLCTVNVFDPEGEHLIRLEAFATTERGAEAMIREQFPEVLDLMAEGHAFPEFELVDDDEVPSIEEYEDLDDEEEDGEE